MAISLRQRFLRAALAGALTAVSLGIAGAASAQQTSGRDAPSVQPATPGIVVQPPLAGPSQPPAPNDMNATSTPGCPFRDQKKLELITS
jgi:hypothetical protein